MKKGIIIVLGILIFWGCTNPEQSASKEDENQEFGNLPSVLIDSLLELTELDQLFEINPDQSNTVVGEKGTILLIPKGAIVNFNGDEVKTAITIRLKEHFTHKDFILSNLQTVHKEKLLVSQGMVYFTAQDKNGKSLKILDGKSVKILVPQDDINSEANIFLGIRDKEGLLDWNQKAAPTKSLTPYPIKFISRSRSFTECPDYYGITKDTLNNNYVSRFGEITDYENTLLATQEFSMRYHRACSGEMVNLYINNLDKNLWEIDQKMVDLLIQDSIEVVNYYLKNPPPKVNGNEITKSQWDAHNSLLRGHKEELHWYINLFKELTAQKLTKIDTSNLVDTTKLGDLNSALIAYDAMKFGWVNVDFFYEDPKAVPIRLIAKTNRRAPLISLIFNSRNVILSGSEHAKNEYWFTKNEGGYNKLPKGEKATIIAIGISGTQLLFGEKEIVIGEKEIENLELESIQGNQLKNKLEKYGS